MTSIEMTNSVEFGYFKPLHPLITSHKLYAAISNLGGPWHEVEREQGSEDATEEQYAV